MLDSTKLQLPYIYNSVILKLFVVTYAILISLSIHELTYKVGKATKIPHFLLHTIHVLSRGMLPVFSLKLWWSHSAVYWTCSLLNSQFIEQPSQFSFDINFFLTPVYLAIFPKAYYTHTAVPIISDIDGIIYHFPETQKLFVVWQLMQIIQYYHNILKVRVGCICVFEEQNPLPGMLWHFTVIFCKSPVNYDIDVNIDAKMISLKYCSLISLSIFSSLLHTWLCLQRQICS